MTQTLRSVGFREPIHYRLTTDELLEWIGHFDLQWSDVKLYLYFCTLNPFGDREIEFNIAELCLLLKLSKSAFYQAAGKLQELELIDLKSRTASIKVFPWNAKAGSPAKEVSNSLLENSPSEWNSVQPNGNGSDSLEDGRPLKQTSVQSDGNQSSSVESCPIEWTAVQSTGSNSNTLEVQRLEPLPEEDSESLQTDPDFKQTLQTLSNSEREKEKSEIDGWIQNGSTESGKSQLTPLAALLPSPKDPESRSIPVAEGNDSAPRSGGVENYRAFENQFRQVAFPWEASPNQPKDEFIQWVAKRHDPAKINLPPLTFAKRMLANSIRRQDGLALNLWEEFQQEQSDHQAHAQACEQALQELQVAESEPQRPVRPGLPEHLPSEGDPSSLPMIQARLQAKWNLPFHQRQHRQEISQELKQHPEWGLEIGPEGLQEVPF
ncbi:MAG: hypothetical protein AAF329_12545 [Cyanobacteria bacterium P01_A01_bin.17]